MNTGKTSKRYSLRDVLAIVGALLLVYGTATFIFKGSESASTVHAQNDPFLDRRISQIEQRFSTLESRLNRIELDTRLPAIRQPSITNNYDIEINTLRTQVESLRLRVGELECSLLKLDERTLSEAARQARRKTVTIENDPCRVGVNAPVKLSARP